MQQSKLRNVALVAAALVVSGTLVATTAFAADSSDNKTKTVHLRGTITKISDSGFTMKTDHGATREIAVASSTKIAGVVPSSLDEVKEGTFIGTANVEDGSGNKALEVVVFPDSMKGTGLGDYAWDLSPSQVKTGGSSEMSMGSGSSMTNGTVEKADSKKADSGFSMGSGSTMTNGTVTESKSGDTMSVKLDYGDGSKMVDIPKDVPVVALQKGSKSDFEKGAHVFIAGPEGSQPFEAKLVMVGIDGTVPPM
ncbi:metal ABC transporter permease [Salinisphaera aquimarina]|uniref:Metal ABC transporter permease n=1 Tax=Salinisphaera aquimarina TaxID=2094031 RepID=A0ABV7ENW1_9GAMM